MVNLTLQNSTNYLRCLAFVIMGWWLNHKWSRSLLSPQSLMVVEFPILLFKEYRTKNSWQITSLNNVNFACSWRYLISYYLFFFFFCFVLFCFLFVCLFCFVFVFFCMIIVHFVLFFVLFLLLLLLLLLFFAWLNATPTWINQCSFVCLFIFYTNIPQNLKLRLLNCSIIFSHKYILTRTYSSWYWIPKCYQI